MRTVLLSRVDIRQALDRSTGALTLKYTGRKLRFFDRMFGYDVGVFFAIATNEVPFPESLQTLASAAGVTVDDQPLAAELRRAVAEVLASEAMLEAPEYLGMVAEPRSEWISSDIRELERRNLAAENRVRELSLLVERGLRRKVAPRAADPVVRSAAPLAPPSVFDRPAPPRHAPPPPPAPAPKVEVEEVEEIDDVGPVETSDATARRVLAAVKAARAEELPQRLPGGARPALRRLPAGLYVSHGAALDRKLDLCAAMMEGAECGKRAGESAVIDWDGEWPVVARRYGAHGRIVYRVEDALRRSGIAVPNEEAA